MEISGSRIGYPHPAVAQRPQVERPPRAPVQAEAAGATGPTQSLRDILTAEERAYFEQLHDLGPVTYGPGAGRAVQAGGPVGQRVDLRA